MLIYRQRPDARRPRREVTEMLARRADAAGIIDTLVDGLLEGANPYKVGGEEDDDIPSSFCFPFSPFPRTSSLFSLFSFLLSPFSFLLSSFSFLLSSFFFLLSPFSFLLSPSSFLLPPSSFLLNPSSANISGFERIYQNKFCYV